MERILSIKAFALENLKAWLKAAERKLVDVAGPNLTLLFTATKASA